LRSNFERWFFPDDDDEVSFISWVPRLLAWLVYGVFWILTVLLGVAILAAFVRYVIPGT